MGKTGEKHNYPSKQTSLSETSACISSKKQRPPPSKPTFGHANFNRLIQIKKRSNGKQL